MSSRRLVADLVWKLECRLNRRLRPVDPVDRQKFLARGTSVDVLGGAALASGPPRLCITLVTHARVDLCRALVEALRGSLEDAGLLQDTFLLIVEDTSAADYSPVLSYLEQAYEGRFAYYESPTWCGKTNRHRIYGTALAALGVLQPEQALFIEDDVTLGPRFIAEARSLWDSIEDPKKAVLYLVCFEDDEVEGRWIRFRRKDVPGGRLRLTQWFDFQAFLVGRSFLEILESDVFRTPPTRWDENPALSCGLPEQFVRRLRHRGNVYQVTEPLGFHGNAASLLNPEARTERTLDNRSRTT